MVICLFFTLSFSQSALAKTEEEKIDKIYKSVDDIYNKVRTNDVKLSFFGTEYLVGDNGTVWLQLLRNYQPINNASCYVDIYSPSKNLIFNNALMNYLINSDGLYYYDLVVPSYIGVYMISVSCYMPQSAWSDDFVDDYLKLESWENITIIDNNIKISDSIDDYCDGVCTPCFERNQSLCHNGCSMISGGLLIESAHHDGDNVTSEALYEDTSIFKVNWDSQVTFVNFTQAVSTILINGDVTGKSDTLIGIFNLYNDNLIGTFDISIEGIQTFIITLNESVDSLYITEAVSTPGPKEMEVNVINSTFEFCNGTCTECNTYSDLFSCEGQIGCSWVKGINYTNGYIQSILINLNATTSWLEFLSSYDLKDGNISFKILDQNNNTICTSLGNISACANSISPIKLYAELDIISSDDISPLIDDWAAIWVIETVEEIKGCGEIHVSLPITDVSINCEDQIICLLEHARILNDRIINFHNTEYCINNMTLQHNITYEYCVGVNCRVLSDIMDEHCLYGCYEDECAPKPIKRILILIGIVILFIIFIVWARKVMN